MDVAIIHSRALYGINSPLVAVEVHLSRGLPGLSIVGMPETAVKESKDRVRSAILNTHFEYPLRRITINLAPADLPKDSGRFDLAIAIGILAASGQVSRTHLDAYEMIGELAFFTNCGSRCDITAIVRRCAGPAERDEGQFWNVAPAH